MQDGDVTHDHGEILNWLQDVVARDGFSVDQADLAASRSWRLQDGALAHRSGRFFRVVGLRYGVRQQPFIEQREIGLLAFILRRSVQGPEILLHAKVEPGNVNVAQIAPSVQATASNLDQVHGGQRPWGASFVRADTTPRLSDTLESEQGTRFIDKFNRNVSVLGDLEIPPGAPLRWAGTTALLRLLDQDFAVNTDARSVLATMPWELLVSGEPFADARDDFGSDLQRSFIEPVNAARLNAVDDDLAQARRHRGDATIIRLHDLQDWQIQPDGTISSVSSPLRAIHIRVQSRSREVPTWDQPILESRATGRADLCVTRISGTLRFGFSVCREPGLARGAELGPTSMACDEPTNEGSNGRVVMACRQSDEGGRFFRDITLYRIVDLNDAAPDPHKVWLRLSEVRALLDRGGYFTNEARTLIALLMRRLVP